MRAVSLKCLYSVIATRDIPGCDAGGESNPQRTQPKIHSLCRSGRWCRLDNLARVRHIFAWLTGQL